MGFVILLIAGGLLTVIGVLSSLLVVREESPNASFLRAENGIVGPGALAITAPIGSLGERDAHLLLTEARTFTASTVVARVYWPERPGVEIEYAVLCARPTEGDHLCEALPQQSGRWHTFTLNLSRFIDDDPDNPETPPVTQDQSGIRLRGLAVMAKFKALDASAPPTLTFYLDAVELWSGQ